MHHYEFLVSAMEALVYVILADNLLYAKFVHYIFLLFGILTLLKFLVLTKLICVMYFHKCVVTKFVRMEF